MRSLERFYRRLKKTEHDKQDISASQKLLLLLGSIQLRVVYPFPYSKDLPYPLPCFCFS